MLANDIQTHVLAQQRLKVLRIEANGDVIAMPEPKMAQEYIIVPEYRITPDGTLTIEEEGFPPMPPIPAEFTHLDGFLLPAEFWPAFGYEGPARFVGMFWTPFGDEAIYTDGRVEADGNWPAYAMLMDHPTNAELLRYPCWLCQGRGTFNDLENESCDECDGMGVLEYNLGSSDLQATHILIADREQGKVYIAPILAGSQFLREQWPPPPLLTATAADAIVEALRRAMSEMGMPDPEEVEQAMQEAQERLEALQRALGSLRN